MASQGSAPLRLAVINAELIAQLGKRSNRSHKSAQDLL